MHIERTHVDANQPAFGCDAFPVGAGDFGNANRASEFLGEDGAVCAHRADVDHLTVARRENQVRVRRRDAQRVAVEPHLAQEPVHACDRRADARRYF
jgi:hypothetical protein